MRILHSYLSNYPGGACQKFLRVSKQYARVGDGGVGLTKV